MGGAREWDAGTYDRLAAPMTARGTALVERIPLAPDARVLDAGCGTGQVTAHLLERLPRGEVIALDGSRAMLDQARDRLGADPRVTFVQADLTRPLPVEGGVDAVVSTSTFHWVPDHPGLFTRLAAVIRPGGLLAADFGGAGNIAAVLRVLEDLGVRDDVWNFPDLDATGRALGDAGFVDVELRRVERPHVPESDEALREYLRTVVLGSHLAVRSAQDGAALVEAVASALPGRVIDYVRVELVARLPGA